MTPALSGTHHDITWRQSLNPTTWCRASAEPWETHAAEMLHLHTGLGQFHTTNKHLSKPVQTKSVFIQLKESNRTEPGGCSRNVSSSLAVRNAAVSGACSEPPPRHLSGRHTHQVLCRARDVWFRWFSTSAAALPRSSAALSTAPRNSSKEEGKEWGEEEGEGWAGLLSCTCWCSSVQPPSARTFP